MNAEAVSFIMGLTIGGAAMYCWHLFATRSLQDQIVDCNDQLFDEKAKGIQEGFEIKETIESPKTNKKPAKKKTKLKKAIYKKKR